MRSPVRALSLALVWFVARAPVCAETFGSHATMLATARVEPRLNLRVSSEVLRFVVGKDSDEATAVVDFNSGSRVLPGEVVELTIEMPDGIAGASGTAHVDVTFSGDVPGTLSGSLSQNRPIAVARWLGGGRRAGRLSFRLRASVPGAYTIPVRFALTVP